ncbi:hypothetical protein [Thiolapillus sp.]|uniref:hypothetical protein n=1 Tax=Thiolapillus sp. TaxID=2017437 RepID=UPI0025FED149|nr:hypothetical protein [Thiolapillus sp.]
MALISSSSDKGSAALLQDELVVPKRKSLRLDTFPLGMDNTRIDVRLEPKLKHAIDISVIFQHGPLHAQAAVAHEQ